jgi:hypothetical protein
MAQATDAPGVHAPLPLHVPEALTAWVASTHVERSGVQAVPLHISHAPAPLHLPSAPQVEPAVAEHRPCKSVAPAASARQVPSTTDCALGKLHAMHAPQEAEAQQTPSTQLPDPHSAPVPQDWPALFWHLLPKHEYPAAASHATFDEHVDAHCPPAHRYPTEHATGVPAVQVPLPLHVPLALAMWWLSTQALWFGVHVVPLHFSQAPAAVHLPSVPQEPPAVAEQSPCGSVTPAPTARQTPSSLPELPGRLQAWQVPQLAVPQQTPSTQLPLVQR